MRTVSGLLLLVAFGAGPAFAGDWPGWRGADRTDVSKETGLLKKWPAGGPKLLWTFEQAGKGYSGFAVVGGKVYTMAAYGSDEYVIALDAKTGKKLWGTKIGRLLKNGWGDGPRGTPTIDGTMLYAISGQGSVVCLTASAGKPVWSKSMKNFGGKTPYWGYTESPLVDGPLVVVTPGGKTGNVVALNKKSGKSVWQAKWPLATKDKAPEYSSVIVAEHGGVRQYIQRTMRTVVGIDAKSGKVLWRTEGKGRTAVIPTPIYHNGHVFVAAGYGQGCRLIEVGKNSPKDVYSNSELGNHHGGVILIEDHLYGYAEKGGWTCMEFMTGKTKWKHRGFKKGAVTYADGHLYCIEENSGKVALVGVSTEGWKEHGTFKLPKETDIRSNRGKIWTHPVISNGRLYLRDQDLIFCYDVKAK